MASTGCPATADTRPEISGRHHITHRAPEAAARPRPAAPVGGPGAGRAEGCRGRPWRGGGMATFGRQRGAAVKELWGVLLPPRRVAAADSEEENEEEVEEEPYLDAELLEASGPELAAALPPRRAGEGRREGSGAGGGREGGRAVPGVLPCSRPASEAGLGSVRAAAVFETSQPPTASAPGPAQALRERRPRAGRLGARSCRGGSSRGLCLTLLAVVGALLSADGGSFKSKSSRNSLLPRLLHLLLVKGK